MLLCKEFEQGRLVGLGEYKIRRIVAVIDPANVASVRVAEKVVMSYEGEVTYSDYGEVSLYSAGHDGRGQARV